MKRTLLYICHLYCESMYTHVYCDTSVAGVAQCALLVSLYVPVESRSYLKPRARVMQEQKHSYTLQLCSILRICLPNQRPLAALWREVKPVCHAGALIATRSLNR